MKKPKNETLNNRCHPFLTVNKVIKEEKSDIMTLNNKEIAEISLHDVILEKLEIKFEISSLELQYSVFNDEKENYDLVILTFIDIRNFKIINFNIDNFNTSEITHTEFKFTQSGTVCAKITLLLGAENGSVIPVDLEFECKGCFREIILS